MKLLKKNILVAVITILSVFFITSSALCGLQFNAQMINLQTNYGSVAGRFSQDYSDVDLYIVLVNSSNNIYSLIWPSSEEIFIWEQGIHILASYDILTLENWGAISPIDFSNIENVSDAVKVFLVLCTRGSDPLDSQNWLDYGYADLVTDPLERVPGQSLFITSTTSYYAYNDSLRPVPTEGTGIDDEDTIAEESESLNKEESEKPDIFKIQDNKMYYANNSAGKFQLIDLSDPYNPILMDSVPLDNEPLELYIADNYSFLLETDYSAQSLTLRVYDSSANSLNQVNYITFENINYILSRKLGNRIFLAGYNYEVASDGYVSIAYESQIIYAVDISNPAEPKKLSQQNIEGYDPDIYIDSNYLILITKDSWIDSILTIFDINAQDDPFAQKTTLDIPGRIPSEYHVSTSDDVLYVGYRQEDITKGSALAVYDLSDFSNIQLKGKVDNIAPGEELYAANFSGDRAYLVTYERQDPLWVIDLKDPSNPVVIGELEVPGWSEYMKFYNDKLLAIGYDDSDGGRLISTALFSVEDPTNPVILDRVTPFQGTLKSTYSEAVDDDRAFYVNNNIVLFPLTYYDNGTVSGLEVVKLDSSWTSFVVNSFIQSEFSVLRGTQGAQEDVVVSMGDAALNTIDIATGEPQMMGSLRLAYNIETVAGIDESDRLWTMGGDFFWNGDAILMIFNSSDLTTPLKQIKTGMNYPEMLIDNEKGIIFSSSLDLLKVIDLSSMNIGDDIKLPEAYQWGSYPLFKGNNFYLTRTEYIYPEDYPDVEKPSIEETSVDEASVEDVDDSKNTDVNDDESESDIDVEPEPLIPYYNFTSIQWLMKKFDCTDMNNPIVTDEFSIPGRPLGFTATGKLVCVEDEYSRSPVYLDEVDTDDQTVTQGMRINLLDIDTNQAILEKSILIEINGYYYPAIVMDNINIFTFIKNEKTTDIQVINAESLEIERQFSIDSLISPLKAVNGKVAAISSNDYYDYYVEPLMVDDTKIYYHSDNYSFYLYDLNGVSPDVLIETKEDYIGSNQVVISKDAVYIVKGYSGISCIPF